MIVYISLYKRSLTSNREAEVTQEKKHTKKENKSNQGGVSAGCKNSRFRLCHHVTSYLYGKLEVRR